MLKLLALQPAMAVDWVVLSADGERASEAHASAERFLGPERRTRIRVESFRERYLP